MQHQLTEEQRTIIADSLRAMAEKYNGHAHASTESGHPRLAAQFDRQEKIARETATLFEDADMVVVQGIDV